MSLQPYSNVTAASVVIMAAAHLMTDCGDNPSAHTLRLLPLRACERRLGICFTDTPTHICVGSCMLWTPAEQSTQPVFRMPDAIPLMVMSMPSRSAALSGSFRSLAMMSACMMFTMSACAAAVVRPWALTLSNREWGCRRVTTGEAPGRSLASQQGGCA
jgi:hypothetical protein